MVIPARVSWRGPFSKTTGASALYVSGEAQSAAPLVVSQQPVQRRAPLIGEREPPVGTRDKTLFEQGGDARESDHSACVSMLKSTARSAAVRLSGAMDCGRMCDV